MSIFIVNDYQNLLITQAAKLDGFFEEASFSFAKGNIPLQFVFDQSEFIDLLFSHAISIQCLL